MHRIFLLLLIVFFEACSSSGNKGNTDGTLTKDQARELIKKQIEKTKNDVGGRKKDIKEFNVDSISQKDSLYTVYYIWSGTMQLPSVPPQPGEEYKGSYEVKNEKAEIRVFLKGDEWEIIPE